MLRTLTATATVLLAALVGMPLLALAGGPTTVPSAEALDDIPPAYLALYQDATLHRCPGLPWPVLAAIGKVESNHGRIGGATMQPDGRVEPRIIGVALDGSPGVAAIPDTDNGIFDNDRAWDRAIGPMQFIPGTWAAYGLDASGDGIADPHNAIDAIHAAATYLCAAGADDAERLPRAVLAYNRSWDYVDRVLTIAARYTAYDLGGLHADPTLIAMVLANPRLDIYPGGRDDIAAGIVDPRVLTLIQLASEHWTLRIGSLKTGHTRCVGGNDHRPDCRVSHHWHGRGVDISIVNGVRVAPTNADAHTLAQWIAALPDPLRPSEVGTPWAALTSLSGYFTDAAHQDHLHIGYRSVQTHP